MRVYDLYIYNNKTKKVANICQKENINEIEEK